MKNILFSSSGSAQDISGSWFWKSADGKAEMEFTLKSEGAEFISRHCAVFQNGNRIDCAGENENYRRG